MTFKTLFKELKSIGLPVAYSHFSEGDVPTLPYVVYLDDGSNNDFADDKVNKKIKKIKVELYSQKKDLASELKIENKLDLMGITYEDDEEFIKEENMFMKTYYFEITYE